jgi:MOSC domain
MATSLQPLGRIVRLQMQKSSLKIPAEPEERYDPAALWAVPDLTLGAEGTSTLLPNGDLFLDIHNAGHPQTKNNKRKNDLSISFTAHYAAMRGRFGDHLSDGIAGENILVAIDRPVTLDELEKGVVIKTAQGEVSLARLRVAAPCSPFSKFASRSTEPETIKGALQFLGGGMRGFYCAFEGESPITIAVGDEVYAA